MSVDVLHACAFADNYIWFIAGNSGNGEITGPRPCIIIDPGDADAALVGLQQHRLEPVAIFCTHHHGDHVGGIQELAGKFDLPIYGPGGIRGITHLVGGGETISVDRIGDFKVLATPGHTGTHISYLGGDSLFCGDTLFYCGCGRLFDGTAEQLYQSLGQLAQLPAGTRVYCAHEYTLSNMAFAQKVDPDNPDLKKTMEKCRLIRARQQPTVPSTIGLELQINPFLRTNAAAVRSSVERHVGNSLADGLSVFTELRRWKDGFTG